MTKRTMPFIGTTQLKKTVSRSIRGAVNARAGSGRGSEIVCHSKTGKFLDGAKFVAARDRDGLIKLANR